MTKSKDPWSDMLFWNPSSYGDAAAAARLSAKEQSALRAEISRLRESHAALLAAAKRAYSYVLPLDEGAENAMTALKAAIVAAEEPTP
jgi:hypothetical protein